VLERVTIRALADRRLPDEVVERTRRRRVASALTSHTRMTMTTPDPTPSGSAPPDADSRARTHLANERTFLAWFRTGIALIALGIAAAQFLSREAVPGVPVVPMLATVLVLTGAFVVAVGAWRYLAGRDRIEETAYEPAYGSILVTTAAALLTGVIAIAFVWLFQPA
jgi:putative membrane protein